MKNGMNIRQCYLILELPMRSPLEEVKLSYKDLVQVWHPDRFAHSPRLQEKAANKLQRLNEAYDTLKNHLERQSVQGAYGYGTASYGTASYGTASYGTTGYDSTSRYGAASPASGDGHGAGEASDNRATATASNPRRSTSTGQSKVPSFFDSGQSYSWQWQLKAAAIILGFIGMMLVPVGLIAVLAEHPLLMLLLVPFPVAAYVYRVWVTR